MAVGSSPVLFFLRASSSAPITQSLPHTFKLWRDSGVLTEHLKAKGYLK
jgi:hypothetical protein